MQSNYLQEFMGLALGLEQAGFNTKLAVEINKWAVKTLKQIDLIGIQQKMIFLKQLKKGIKNYLKDNEEIDLVSGGYPCQSFSYAEIDQDQKIQEELYFMIMLKY